MKEKIGFGLLNSSSLSSFNDNFYYADQHVDVTSYYSVGLSLMHESTTLNALSHQQLCSFKEQEIAIPLIVLKNRSSLQAIVVYLHECKNLNFSKIASLLNRNQRTIWATYASAKRKKLDFKEFDEPDSKFNIPLEVLSSRNLSVLETIVFYLKSNSFLSFNELSALLGKNYRTVWTVYRRALIKIKRKKSTEKNMQNELTN